MISYQILYNDPVSHVVTLRWRDGENFRDEAFNLEMVYPGAMKMFADMELDFNYDASLTYLERRCQQMIDGGFINVTPPSWNDAVPFRQTIATTPVEFMPVAADPDE